MWKNFFSSTSEAIKSSKTKELTWSMLPQASWFVFNSSLFLKSTRQNTCLNKARVVRSWRERIQLAFGHYQETAWKQLNSLLGKFLNFEEKDLYCGCSCFASKKTLLSRSVCKSRYSSCSKFGGLHESRTGLSLRVDFRSRESVFLPSEVERESRNNAFVGFLEDVSLAGRVGLTSILVGAKLRNMPKPVKEKATNWCYSVALTHLAVRQNLLDPKNNVTSSPESL